MKPNSVMIFVILLPFTLWFPQWDVGAGGQGSHVWLGKARESRLESELGVAQNGGIPKNGPVLAGLPLAYPKEGTSKESSH